MFRWTREDQICVVQTVFGDRVFEDVIKVRLGRARSQYKEFLEEGIRAQTRAHTEWRPCEGGHGEKTTIRKPRREGSGETSPVDTLTLEFQPPDCERVDVCG